jgi:hypothetical protein
MRRSSTAILALVLVTTAAQGPGGGALRGGLSSGAPTLTNPNPFTHPNWPFPPRFGTGSNGSWTSGRGGRRAGFFPDPLILNWNGWPPFDGYGFYNTPDPGYRIGPYWPDYYPQPNVPLLPPAPVEQQGPAGGETVPEAAENSTPETTGMPVYRGPATPPDTTDEHPPLIALKNRWAYTVLKYWVKGKTFHFITTQGDHMQVSTNMVDRIYPTPNRALKTEPRPESPH